MVLTNYSTMILDYVDHQNPYWVQKYKTYTIGLMFEASIIESEVDAISAKFLRTFNMFFLLPYMIIVIIMIAGEIL